MRTREIAKALYGQLPDDIRQQQALVREADGLIFVAPAFWMGFPGNPQRLVGARPRLRIRLHPERPTVGGATSTDGFHSSRSRKR